MKKNHFLFAALLLSSFISTSAQDSIRTVIDRASSKFRHSIYGWKTDNDPHTIYYVDNEKEPFTGRFLTQSANGATYYEEHFKNGLKHGPYYEYAYPKGDSMYIKVEKNYKNGVLCGKYVERNSPIHKNREWTYDERGRIHGKAVFFMGYSSDTRSYSSDTLAIEYYNHGIEVGTWTTYYRGGQISHIEKHDGNRRENISYFRNGKIKERTFYVNRTREGNDSIWYESGQLRQVTGYLNGSKHGKDFLFYENGQMKEERTFEHGQKRGRFVFYFKDGTIKEETEYK